MSEQRINEYIEGKYGKLGVDRYATLIFLRCIIFVKSIKSKKGEKRKRKKKR